MTAIVLRRVAELLLLLLTLSVLVFLLTSLAPGDPAEEILRRGGIQPTAASVAALRAELGLDQPLFSQYLRWSRDVLRGDLGRSYADRSPVAAEILSRAPTTLRLAGSAAVVAVGLASLVALRGAFQPRALDSRALALVTVAIAGIPPYIVGILLISVVAVGLRALPTGGDGSPAAVVLPALTLGLAGAATLLRLLRADLARALRLPFVKLAAVKGLRRRRTLVVHALRVAAPNAITATSLVLAELMAGAVVVETLFAWPGVGQLAVTAIKQRDLPVVQAYVLIVAVATVLLLALTELCLAASDPRLRRR
ncbi:peptide/nickel transport system permease protein/nickel transport system permease protein [Nonomuraea solani]|uniref:Peptide/nickel transport system permease protein/nickel transport system permease protein n=1 Tax=Nonomuraea solani TaxID=1144553 RepID=A0A1H6DAK1_9ACTN|nr:ABC transporter permease [Nonomuraea solani]SEG82248.1 peptide/nickel transport system permease protein/nickel transport system permease protein [Nonomuraea solani]